MPGVIPLNVYAGNGVGEAASMQGFEMLLYGIPTGTLFDKQSQKWVVARKAFTDALTAYEQVWNQGLGPTPQQALAPTWANTVAQELLPQQKLAIDLDGSWLSNNWLDERCRAVAGVAYHSRERVHADPERPGQRQGDDVRRLDLGDSEERQERQRRLGVHQNAHL